MHNHSPAGGYITRGSRSPNASLSGDFEDDRVPRNISIPLLRHTFTVTLLLHIAGRYCLVIIRKLLEHKTVPIRSRVIYLAIP